MFTFRLWSAILTYFLSHNFTIMPIVPIYYDLLFQSGKGGEMEFVECRANFILESVLFWKSFIKKISLTPLDVSKSSLVLQFKKECIQINKENLIHSQYTFLLFPRASNRRQISLSLLFLILVSSLLPLTSSHTCYLMRIVLSSR